MSKLTDDPRRLASEISKREALLRRADRGSINISSSQYQRIKRQIEEYKQAYSKFVFPENNNTTTPTYTISGEKGEKFGISIAPELAEAQIKAQNDAAAKKQSIADSLFKKQQAQQVYQRAISSPIQAPSISEKKPYIPPGTAFFRKGLANVAAKQEEASYTMRSIDAQYKGKVAPLKEVGRYYGAAATSLGLGIVEGYGYPLFYPTQTAKSLIKPFTQSPLTTFNEFRGAYQESPPRFLGQMYGTGKVFGIAGKGFNLGRELVIKVAAKDVGAMNILDPKSATIISEGGTAFPTTTSVSDSLIQFSKGKTDSGVNVISASPAPIKTLGQSRILKISSGERFVEKVTGSLKSKRSLGLYAAPAEKGSAYFLGIGKQEGYSFSLLPKGNKPSLAVLEVSSVKRIPKSVLRQGVIAENNFLSKDAVKGAAYISGNTERMFNSRLPSAFKTTESEVVIPEGSLFRSKSKSILGFDKRIEFMNRQVPVREYGRMEGKPSFADNLKSKLPSFENELTLKVSKSGEKYYSYKKNLSPLRLSYLRYSSSPPSSVLGLSSITSKSASSLSRPISSSSLSRGSSSLSRSSSSIYRLSSLSSLSRRSYSLFRSSSSIYRASPSYSLSRGSSSYSVSRGSSFVSTKYYDDGLRRNLKVPKLSLFKKEKPIKYGYSASLEADLFNIRAPKINMKTFRTGLALRPIIVRK